MGPGFLARAAVAFAALHVAAAGCGGAGARGAASASSSGGPRGVEAAALPFRVLHGRGGAELAEPALLAALAGARAVCIGEQHSNPHDHWAQLHLLERLLAQNRAAGVASGLGLEMVQRPFQGVLDDFAAGRIDEAALLARSGWTERWGHDFALYRPLLARAVAQRAALVALNTPRELTKKVSREGLAALSPAERAALPELVLDDAEHRAWWRSIMSEMGGAEGHAIGATAEPTQESSPSPSASASASASASPTPAAPDPERIYAAQVLWDETMADVAARWLAGGARRQLVILAGSGHCHESAIVRRLERRGAGEVVSVRPLIDRGDGEVARLLAQPAHDFLFLMSRR